MTTQIQNTVVFEEVQQESPRDNFTVIPNAIFKMGLRSHSIALYVCLKRVASGSVVCRHSTQALARKSGISMIQVLKSERALEAAGLIRIQKEPYRGGVRRIITIVR